MKKVLLLAAFGVAGLMSAKNSIVDLHVQTNYDEFMGFEFLNVPAIKIAAVTSDCGEGGTWYVYGADDGSEIDYEQADDLRQELNEAFCGY